MPDFTQISYVVDASDRIVSVSPEWSDFALQNDGEGLAPEEVIGQSLWRFIADESTKTLYAAVLAHVRRGPTTELVLRCDAPERRRLIEMTVTRQTDGRVEFRTVLLSSKQRPVQRLFAKSTPRNDRRLPVCSWCDKVKVADGKWFEVEGAMEYLRLAEDHMLPQIESVVCQHCYTKVIVTVQGASTLSDGER